MNYGKTVLKGLTSIYTPLCEGLIHYSSDQDLILKHVSHNPTVQCFIFPVRRRDVYCEAVSLKISVSLH